MPVVGGGRPANKRLEIPCRPLFDVDPGGCQLDWMRKQGMWTAADDASVLARYGRDAFDDHWYCCRAQPWRQRGFAP